MIVSDVGQARVFLINIAFGVICIMLFDMFGAIVKKYGKTAFVINAVDIIYFSIAFLIIFYAVVKFNFGALRYYQIMGLLLGMVVWYTLFSRIERKVFSYLIEKAIVLTKLCTKCICKPIMFVLRVILTPLVYIETKFVKLSEKLKRRKEKIIKNRRKTQKSVKKRRKMI